MGEYVVKGEEARYVSLEDAVDGRLQLFAGNQALTHFRVLTVQVIGIGKHDRALEKFSVDLAFLERLVHRR
ncbi:CO or xanthine dehydrogenase [Pseudomonas syringae pv. actinidiae]|uniref:CO or xanthine dehydrogenase n=1 Tax=Pseudomonas syringae pv. actinidiae TaxID=103796 RepID=A0AAN4QBZ6_PSESF|nr:CO or xanthine dehydrogenase [Pseudomonas syringae pv. actinidiae]